MSDTASANYALKDVLLAVPALGSGLAITYEVGSFLPIGLSAFGFFSITEHLTFALQALPIAMFAAGYVMAWVALTFAVTRRRAPAMVLARRFAGSAYPGRRVRWLVRGVVALTWITSIAMIYAEYLSDTRSAITLVLTAMVFVSALAVSFSLRFLRTKTFMVPFIILSLLALALAIGVDATRSRLNTPDAISAQIKFSDRPTIEARILRAGDRGLLVYQHADQRFMFVRSEPITSIDWKRSTLLPAKQPAPR